MKVELHPRFKRWKPRSIERVRKMILEGFNSGDSGHSNHSPMAMTLPFIINYCEENKIPYKLIAHPGEGYYIERLPKERIK